MRGGGDGWRNRMQGTQAAAPHNERQNVDAWGGVGRKLGALKAVKAWLTPL